MNETKNTYGIESHADPVTAYTTPAKAQATIDTMHAELYAAFLNGKISMETFNHYRATTVTRVVLYPISELAPTNCDTCGYALDTDDIDTTCDCCRKRDTVWPTTHDPSKPFDFMTALTDF